MYIKGGGLAMNKLRLLLDKYKHSWVLLYFFIYFPWFNYLEKTVTPDSKYTVMYSKIDDLIPFNEVFVIPYSVWFLYVAFVVMLFFFISKEDFYKCCAYLFIGMTICLIIYSIFPNGQALRVSKFPRDNALTDMVKKYYANDTPTNVCPSIHSFNSIVLTVSLFHCSKVTNSRFKLFARISSITLTLLIMLSTLFIKQHSVIDMLAAVVLSLVLYPVVYLVDYKVLAKNLRKNLSVKINTSNEVND